MSNASFVDPFEGRKMIVYSFLGTVMTLAISLNIVNCVVMIKNKDLRKHNQFIVYITISLTEAFIGVLFIVIIFWRQDGVEYFCVSIFLLLTIGREIIQVHLLCLCLERYFALSVSLIHVFRKLTSVKGRLVILLVCIILSFVVFAPVAFIHANKDVYSCGPDTLFGTNARFVLRFSRTIYSVQVLAMLGIYLCVIKKIRTLILPSSTGVSFSRHVVINVQSFNSESKSKPMLNNCSQELKDITKTLNNVKPTSVKDNLSDSSNLQTVQQTKANLTAMSKHPISNTKSIKQGKSWKPRTLKMLRTAIFATVIPSIPMLALQIGDYLNPTFMNASLDVVISLCNVFHSFVFPLVFIVTVKQPKCCKKN